MSSITVIGIDPGSCSGCVVAMSDEFIRMLRLEGATERDVSDFIRNNCASAMGFIERVGPMRGPMGRKQGVASSFKFGQSYGFLRGLLIGLGIPFEEVTPQKWQKEIGCLTKGDKNVSKAKAQQLFPREKIIHANADALLIAEYGRRVLNQRNGSAVKGE